MDLGKDLVAASTTPLVLAILAMYGAVPVEQAKAKEKALALAVLSKL